jgi:hypothetical protein
MTRQDAEALRKAVAYLSPGASAPSLPLTDRVPKAVSLLLSIDLSDGWQPIETAPRTGERVRLWIPSYQNRDQIGRWQADQYAAKPRPYWEWLGYSSFKMQRRTQPTHWQPLSEGPEEL